MKKPIYHRKKYFCPICYNEIKQNQKKHCNFELDWKDVKNVPQQINIMNLIKYEKIKPSYIANNIGYERSYIFKMLSGKCYMSDILSDYLIKEIEEYIQKLQELLKELRRRNE